MKAKVEKTCLTCSKLFVVFPCRKDTAFYCSRNCRAKNTVAGYWTGKKRPEMVGKNNLEWKGTTVGYRALHRWVERWLGKPCKCEFCGKEKTTKKSIHWANKSHKYFRNLSDWFQLCAKCHKAYDREYKGL